MFIHVVQKGDTLWQLANRYGVSISDIVTSNELPSPDRVVIGQALLIPSKEQFYTVQSGDTLWAISQRFGVSFQSLIQANHITDPALIYPGTSLLIPSHTHIVQSGETLWRIAQMYGTTINAIIKANPQINPNLIYPGTSLIIPRFKPVIEVNGYTINMGEKGGEIVQEVGEYLTYVSPFGYRIQADGGLSSISDTATIQAAQANRVVPMMSITNFSSTELGSNLAHTILANTDIQNVLLTNIINTMKAKGYGGLNIDFENVLPADRELYNAFLQRAVDRLHPEGFFVSTALAPKVSAEQKGLLYEAHDYAAHGRIVDFVVLMTYEWGYRLGPPQAISPLNQIKRVLDYAVSVIPRNKIFMGFQLYARDWILPHVKGTEAETFSPQEAVIRAINNNATIQYDKVAESPFYRYIDSQGRTHEVWFEDARSAQAKFDTVKSYNLRGISYWVLGYPYPQNWLLLDDNFTIQKRK